MSSNTGHFAHWPVVIVIVYSLLLLPLLTHSLLNHPAEYDELLHVLAARSLNDTGIPTIADGEYYRAILYTKIVAFVNGFSDSELLISRMPALVSGMLLIALSAGWITARAGWLAGIGTATILAIAPSTVHVSVLVRFYTLHALCVTAMVIFMYEACAPRVTIPRLLVFGSLAAISFSLAIQLQVLTLITFLGACAGTALVIALDYHKVLMRLLAGRSVWIFTASLLTGVLVFFTLQTLNIDLAGKLRGFTPAWSESKADNVFFYMNALGTFMPFIWPIFPVMAFAAIIGHPRQGAYMLTIILIAFIISSLASQKATRYIYHFFPLVCILWGVGFQTLAKAAIKALSQSPILTPRTAWIAVLLSLSMMVFSTEEIKRALKLATGKGTLDRSIPVLSEPDWTTTRAVLEKFLPDTEDLIVTSGVKSLHAFNRYDYELSKTVVAETPTAMEFGLDARTGKQVISDVTSLVKIVDDPGQEIVVLENRMMNTTYSATTEVVDWLNQHCTTVKLPAISLLSAWHCQEL